MRLAIDTSVLSKCLNKLYNPDNYNGDNNNATVLVFNIVL
jgi:hypothetical protein